MVESTSAPMTSSKPEPPGTEETRLVTNNGSLGISEELVKLCELDMNNAATAPKFDFDESELLPQDRAVLQQIATCVIKGPLKGKSLDLIGRADPRGEVEYNMSLGARRAAQVDSYLTALGVPVSSLTMTSRGKLDAVGTDEVTWARDRRVDIILRR